MCTGRLDVLGLSKPSIHKNHFVVGSDDPQGEDCKDHHIMCVSLEDLRHGKECLVSCLALDEV